MSRRSLGNTWESGDGMNNCAVARLGTSAIDLIV
jgi:hypothetical protein